MTINLTSHERKKFATWLEAEAATEDGLVKQLEKLPGGMVPPHMKQEIIAAIIISKKLRNVEEVTINGDQPLRIERTSREVIENQLLTSLEDGSRCAIVATEDELKMLLTGMDVQLKAARSAKVQNFREDMYKLGQQCYGWPALPPA